MAAMGSGGWVLRLRLWGLDPRKGLGLTAWRSSEKADYDVSESPGKSLSLPERQCIIVLMQQI